MKENYQILGLNENATREEIDAAYKSLKEKYMRDRFLEGEAGNEAAKNLTKLENAYNEIISEFKESDEDGVFRKVKSLINEGNLNQAQDELDAFSERDAEWHYLQSVIFYKKNWYNESKKQLEIAIDLDKNEQKYKQAYDKLNNKMKADDQKFHSGNANFSTENTERQMGGGECSNMAECCVTWCCLNMLCNSCR